MSHDISGWPNRSYFASDSTLSESCAGLADFERARCPDFLQTKRNLIALGGIRAKGSERTRP